MRDVEQGKACRLTVTGLLLFLHNTKWHSAGKVTDTLMVMKLPTYASNRANTGVRSGAPLSAILTSACLTLRKPDFQYSCAVLTKAMRYARKGRERAAIRMAMARVVRTAKRGKPASQPGRQAGRQCRCIN